MDKGQIINILLMLALLVVITAFSIYMFNNIEWIKANPCDMCEQLYHQNCYKLNNPYGIGG